MEELLERYLSKADGRNIDPRYALYHLFLPCRYLKMWQPNIFSFLTNLYPGTYALIGAASFLGGVVRMTISLTAILIESTNELSLGLPIMISILVHT